MEHPVYGIIYQAAEDEQQHAHDIFLVVWDGRPVHVHRFSGVTSFDAGHRHQYAGTTEPAATGVPHTHGYVSITSFNDGHTHSIRGITGPSIDLPGGGHFHLFQGVTSVNGVNPHTHTYSGQTGNEL